jgi:hypothetical protein
MQVQPPAEYRMQMTNSKCPLLFLPDYDDDDHDDNE